MKKISILIILSLMLSITPAFATTQHLDQNIDYMDSDTTNISYNSLATQAGGGKTEVIIRFAKTGWSIIQGLSTVQWCYSNLPKSWRDWFEGTVNWAYTEYSNVQKWLEANKKPGAWDPFNFVIII